jgi:hypothetical protein
MKTTKTKSVREVMKLLSSLGVSTEGVEKGWLMSEVLLPACVVGVVEGGCQGCMVKNGLYLQCTNSMKKSTGGVLCGKCELSCLTEGRPKHGLYSERLNPLKERFTDGVWRTEEGKEGTSWHQYLLNMGLSREDGEKILRDKGIDLLSDKEWELKERKKRGRQRTVSDSSSDGGVKSETSRFIPVDGKRKSPPKGESHKGINGALLRVYVCKETRNVRKGNPSNWTDEANAKFVEMYCNSDEEAVAKDFGATKKKKKNSAAQDQLAELQARLVAAEARAIAAEAAAIPVAQVAPPAPQVAAAPEIPPADEKKKKMEALKKAKAEKKKKADDEKKKKIEESKRQQELLMTQLAELQAGELSDVDNDDEELGEFDDSDDEGQEFNPFEHDGVKYHRDDKDNLYTEDGEFWGHVTTEGVAVEGNSD